MAGVREDVIQDLCYCLFASYWIAVSCSTDTDNVLYRKECYHSTANVTVLQDSPPSGEFVSVNYFISREAHQFVPITVDIHHSGKLLAAFRCENGSVADRGSTIVEVIFTGWCEDPTVIIDSRTTLSISLDLHAMLSACSAVTIGPQRLGLFSQVDSGSKQLAPFLRIQNVDTCNRVGPAVPIRLSTSADSSIVLYPDGSNETVGDISVWSLPCNDSHTQVYGVLVSSAENYTVYGEIINALLPISCIFVPVSVSPIMESTHSTTTTTSITGTDLVLYVVISVAAIVLIIGSLAVLAVVLGLIVLCRHKRKKKNGVNGAGESRAGTTMTNESPEARTPRPLICSELQGNPAYEPLGAVCQSQLQTQAPAFDEVMDVTMHNNPAYQPLQVAHKGQPPAGIEEVVQYVNV